MAHAEEHAGGLYEPQNRLRFFEGSGDRLLAIQRLARFGGAPNGRQSERLVRGQYDGVDLGIAHEVEIIIRDPVRMKLVECLVPRARIDIADPRKTSPRKSGDVGEVDGLSQGAAANYPHREGADWSAVRQG